MKYLKYRPLRPALTAASSALLVFAAACGNPGSESGPESGSPSATSMITVDNCEDTVDVPHPPQRVMVTGSESIPTLAQLGVLDSIAVRAGVFPPAYFDELTNAALAEIPSLTDRIDATGHLQISMEQTLAEDPDLVLGATDTVNRQTLAPHNIPLIEEPAFCGALDGPVTWEDVWEQISLYGNIFDKDAAAEAYISKLKEQLHSVEEHQEGRGLSVAILYPEVGGATTYAYGNRSMSYPLVETTGLRNVFGDVEDRVFEVSAEEIVARNPDVIVALHTDGEPAEVINAITSLRGIGAVPAVKEKKIMPLLLNYAEPATPLSVQGAQRLNDFLRQDKG